MRMGRIGAHCYLFGGGGAESSFVALEGSLGLWEA